MRAISKLIAGALLSAAVIGTASAADEWNQVAYSCESGPDLNVAFKANRGAARVTLADKPLVRLVARQSKDGELYTDSRHELRVMGETATWQVGDRSPVKCTAANGTQLAESPSKG